MRKSASKHYFYFGKNMKFYSCKLHNIINFTLHGNIHLILTSMKFCLFLRRIGNLFAEEQLNLESIYENCEQSI